MCSFYLFEVFEGKAAWIIFSDIFSGEAESQVWLGLGKMKHFGYGKIMVLVKC